ncbi:hotdog fold thioesterase [Brevibacterium samyangense]|uniref:Thioesterase domain-containing protein n=1 Tax=Brevibacterium samyangense TaxID=366888 RepID=A0ABN2THQ8_9MICO
MTETTLPRMEPGLTPEQYRMLMEYNQGRAEDTLVEKVGIEFTDMGFDWIEARMPVAGNLQPAGLLHGGAHVVMAETLGSMHAFLLANGKNVVGVDLNATHVRAARDGWVFGRAEVLHHGRTLISHEVKMTNEAGKLLSIVRITNMVLASRARDEALTSYRSG